METPEIPATFEVNMEIPTGVYSTAKPVHVEVGIMFNYVHLTIDKGGWAPQVIYCNNLQTGQKYSRNEAARILNPKRLAIALDSIHWQLNNDPDADKEDREVFRMVCGIDSDEAQ